MFQRVLLDFVLKTFGLGAENETRTRDPNLGKVVLYQLSYFRICHSAKIAKLLNDANGFTRFASANIKQIFLLCKKFLKNLHFWCVFLQKPPFLHTISAQNR